MPFNAQGQWVPEDDSVAGRVTALTSGDSAYIKGARAAGMATANKRGLLNASLAAGASEGAAIAAAAPIASQDASQIAQKNLAFQGQGYTKENMASQAGFDMEKINAQAAADMERQKLVTASADRQAAAQLAAAANANYLDSFSNIANNKDIPAATRDAYIKHLLDTRGSGLDLVQQVYGINLNWAGKPGTEPPPAGDFGVVPTDKDGVQGGGGGYSARVANV